MTVIENLEQSLEQLPDEERDELGAAFVEVVQLVHSTTEPLSEDDRRAWLTRLGQVLEGVTTLVVTVPTGAGKTLAVEHLLAGPLSQVDSEPSIAELEKLNTANRFQQWHQAIRESFSTGELEKKFGVTRQRLEQLRKRGKLLGLQPPFERGFFYPVWEFDEYARPHELIPALIEAAEDANLDPLSLHRLMVSERATSEGSLMLALKAGKDNYVLDVVRASGAQGS
jgi:hypothetical protein